MTDWTISQWSRDPVRRAGGRGLAYDDGMRAASPNRPDQPAVVVAGHICLDIIPALPADPEGAALRPGSLDSIGAATLAIGGCVGNTGLALHRLGLPTTLVARVADDPLGRVLCGLVAAAMPGGASHLRVTAGQAASYSIVLNRPGEDRAIGHFPGVNDSFIAGDVAHDLLRGAALLHVGYPPLMAAMVADGARELRQLLAAARASGLATSLDMANANLEPGPGGIPWAGLLPAVLPDVDVFLPSLDEACHLLGREVERDRQGAPVLASVARLSRDLLDLGVAVSGVKLGSHGLYVRTAGAGRIARMPRAVAPAWADRELYSTVFEVDVVGTAGAGDSTIAGFLYGLLTGMSPEDTMAAACAVGATSTEAPDGTSGVPGWPAIRRRLDGGWRRTAADPGPGWRQGPGGSWHGPHDGAGSSAQDDATGSR